MTAIDAAIVELEAQRERIGLLIHELRRHARGIEDSHQPQPAPRSGTVKGDTVLIAYDVTYPSVAPAAPTTQPCACEKRQTPRPPLKALGTITIKVRDFVRGQAQPVKVAQVVKGTKLSLLREYDAAYPFLENQGYSTHVTLRRDRRFVKTPDWLINYRHPDRATIRRMTR